MKSFKKILENKIVIYENLLKGYKNLDSFFVDSKIFLKNLEQLEKLF